MARIAPVAWVLVMLAALTHAAPAAEEDPQKHIDALKAAEDMG